MIFWTLLSVCYGAITVFALYMTHQEQKGQDCPNPFDSLIGYLICTIWPLAVLFMIASQRLDVMQPVEAD